MDKQMPPKLDYGTTVTETTNLKLMLPMHAYHPNSELTPEFYQALSALNPYTRFLASHLFHGVTLLATSGLLTDKTSLYVPIASNQKEAFMEANRDSLIIDTDADGPPAAIASLSVGWEMPSERGIFANSSIRRVQSSVLNVFGREVAKGLRSIEMDKQMPPKLEHGATVNKTANLKILLPMHAYHPDSKLTPEFYQTLSALNPYTRFLSSRLFHGITLLATSGLLTDKTELYVPVTSNQKEAFMEANRDSLIVNTDTDDNGDWTIQHTGFDVLGPSTELDGFAESMGKVSSPQPTRRHAVSEAVGDGCNVNEVPEWVDCKPSIPEEPPFDVSKLLMEFSSLASFVIDSDDKNFNHIYSEHDYYIPTPKTPVTDRGDTFPALSDELQFEVSRIESASPTDFDLLQYSPHNNVIDCDHDRRYFR